MHKIILRTTRAIMSAATTLHIAGLRAGVSAHNAAVSAAMKMSDVATVAAREANEFKAEAKADEREAFKARDAFIKAAQVEANMLRRGVVIG